MTYEQDRAIVRSGIVFSAVLFVVCIIVAFTRGGAP
jgi:hypothetical protein